MKLVDNPWNFCTPYVRPRDLRVSLPGTLGQSPTFEVYYLYLSNEQEVVSLKLALGM